MEEIKEVKYAPGLTLEALAGSLNQGELRDQAKEYMQLMSRYSSAMLEVETKFKVLNIEFNARFDRNPIESIKTRLKKPKSIAEKMQRLGVPLTVQNVEKHLNDVAGVRVICSFVDDIYKLADMLSIQDDVYVIEIKDYIKNPKPSGYRSLHMIIETPIFLSNEKRYMRVEVQLRTIAMDFWASLEHKLRYKKDIPEETAKQIAKELGDCAQAASDTDQCMYRIRCKMEAAGVHTGIEA